MDYYENKMDVLVGDKKPTKLDYFLVFALLCYSGNLFIVGVGPYLQTIFIIGFILTLLFWLLKGAKNKSSIFIFLSGWVVIIILQSIFGIYWAFNTVLFMTIKIMIGITIFSILGNKLREAYFRVIFFLSFTSLIFFFANSLGVFFEPIATYGDRNTIFIYTQLQDLNTGITHLRNSGMFWEPGAFQGYINIAFLFFLPQLGQIWTQHKFMMATIIVALITTFSTTGYILFAIIILSYMLFFKKGTRLNSLLLFSMTFILFSFIFFRVDFLSKKLGIDWTTTKDEIQIGGNRMINLTESLQLIYKSPLLGYGYSQKSLSITNEGFFSNGWAAELFFMGILWFCFYHFFLIKNLLKQKLKRTWLMIFLLCNAIMLQSEVFLSHPFFLALPFALFGATKYIDKTQEYNFQQYK